MGWIEHLSEVKYLKMRVVSGDSEKYLFSLNGDSKSVYTTLNSQEVLLYHRTWLFPVPFVNLYVLGPESTGEGPERAGNQSG